MIKVTLRDTVKEFNDGINAYEIAKSFGGGFYKNVCAARINGVNSDLRTVLKDGDTLELLTFEDEYGRWTFRHTASHIMAQAVKRLYPNAKLAIGPAVDDGFYYDFDIDEKFTPDDLKKIEDEMKKIVKEDIELTRFALPKAEAVAKFEAENEPYKVELAEGIADGEEISFYAQGDFTDLCAGAHLMSTGAVKAFKLTSATGAYWRGDSSKKMLCRVYGTAFPKASELEAHLAMLEEAKKRDHNKLGRELEIFTTVDCIGQGLPIMLPKGTKILQILQRFVEDEEERRGWLRTKTPLMAKSDLYKISGHWDHYRDGMFVMGDPDDESKECFALRPMTCPFQYQAYLNRARSYRDLPLRYGETSTLSEMKNRAKCMVLSVFVSSPFQKVT